MTAYSVRVAILFKLLRNVNNIITFNDNPAKGKTWHPKTLRQDKIPRKKTFQRRKQKISLTDVSTKMTHSDWSDLMVCRLPVGLCCWRPTKKRSNFIIPSLPKQLFSQATLSQSSSWCCPAEKKNARRRWVRDWLRIF